MCLVEAVAAVVVLTITLSVHDSWPQTTNTIKIIVPFPPGGPADILARSLADQIGRVQRLTMVVENRPGASGDIGNEAASRAVPDGKTLLVVGNPFVINPYLRKLNYDPLTIFEPICKLTTTPTVIAVNSRSTYRTLADLLSAARAKPGTLTTAGIGPASSTHLAFEALKRAAKVDMTFVSYPGSPPAVNSLLGDHVTSFFGNYSAVSEQLKAGTFRALAAATQMRIESLPDVPTIAESGFMGSSVQDYDMDLWFGLLAPAKTPKQAVSQLATWFSTAMQVPEVKAKLVVQGLYPSDTCGADFAAFLSRQYGDYGRIIRDANIKTE